MNLFLDDTQREIIWKHSSVAVWFLLINYVTAYAVAGRTLASKRFIFPGFQILGLSQIFAAEKCVLACVLVGIGGEKLS